MVGCNLDGSTETVFAVDTYNPESRTNIRDIDDSVRACVCMYVCVRVYDGMREIYLFLM